MSMICVAERRAVLQRVAVGGIQLEFCWLELNSDRFLCGDQDGRTQQHRVLEIRQFEDELSERRRRSSPAASSRQTRPA